MGEPPGEPAGRPVGEGRAASADTQSATGDPQPNASTQSSPLDPLKAGAWCGKSWALFSLERYEEGRAVALKAVQQGADAHSLSALAANAVAGGHAAEAREAVARILRFNPGFGSAQAREAFPVRLPQARERIVAALHEAGLPD